MVVRGALDASHLTTAWCSLARSCPKWDEESFRLTAETQSIGRVFQRRIDWTGLVDVEKDILVDLSDVPARVRPALVAAARLGCPVLIPVVLISVEQSAGGYLARGRAWFPAYSSHWMVGAGSGHEVVDPRSPQGAGCRSLIDCWSDGQVKHMLAMLADVVTQSHRVWSLSDGPVTAEDLEKVAPLISGYNNDAKSLFGNVDFPSVGEASVPDFVEFLRSENVMPSLRRVDHLLSAANVGVIRALHFARRQHADVAQALASNPTIDWMVKDYADRVLVGGPFPVAGEVQVNVVG